MPFWHLTVAIAATGVAQRVSDSLADPTVGGVSDIPFRQFTVQAGAGNGNPGFLGGPGVTVLDYGIRVPAPVGGIPAEPIVLGGFDTGPVKPSHVWIVGTQDELFHFSGIPF
jgi:hypothetical protein